MADSKSGHSEAAEIQEEEPIPNQVEDRKSTGSKNSDTSRKSKKETGNNGRQSVGKSNAVAPSKKSGHGSKVERKGPPNREISKKEELKESIVVPIPDEDDNDDDDPELLELMGEEEVRGEEDDYLFPQAYADLERLGEEEDMLSTISSETGEYESEEYLGEEETGEFPEDELEIRDDDFRGYRAKKRMSTIRRETTRNPEEVLGEVTLEWVEPEYYREDFISRSITSGAATGFTQDILKLYHSYGFDTQRPFNIQCLDKNHIVYICGNYLHFYNIPSQKVVFLHRSASGLGLGHVAVHPSRKYFAVGEKGDKPFIIIYTWPDLKVFRVLRKGTLRGFASLDFDSSGDLLCSQGLGPDFMLTIWDWRHEKILTRQKGSQEVYRANFSPSTATDVTTCGLDFIQFWKLIETENLTGTGTVKKLVDCQLGNFGHKNPYEIFGFTGLSDGKVVAGSPWGNLIVWDNGSIVVEISQKEGKNCHGKQIMDIKHQDTELLTIGRDGFVRTWETELIELASLSVDADIGIVQVEPLLELNLGTVYQPVSAVRVPSEVPTTKNWLIQDAWGKVWNIDINAASASTEYSPSTLFFAPGGAIAGIAVSPKFSIMVVGTTAGHLWAFEYIQKLVIARKVYVTPVAKVVWVPMKYDPKGSTFLTAFQDGTVRLMTLNPLDSTRILSDVEVGLTHELSLVQSLKFHRGKVLVMRIDQLADILYTTGADRVIFASRISFDETAQKPLLIPLSFVTSPFPVVSLDFHPTKNYRFIIAGSGGRVAECRRPLWDDIDSSVSYNKGKLHGKRWFYSSVKSARLHEEDRQLRRRNRLDELETLYQSIAERKAAGMIVAEELEVSRVIDRYSRQQEKEDEKEFVMPDSPCQILSVHYHVNPRIGEITAGQTFFLNVDGFDAGYIYECKYNRPEPGGFHRVPPTPPFASDVGVRCFLVSSDDQYLLFGMTDGSIRVMRRSFAPQTPLKRQESIIQPSTGSGSSSDGDDFHPVRLERKKSRRMTMHIPPFPVSHYPYDLQNFWTLPMHDPDRGPVVELAWSFDHEFLISVGQDGAIFAYRWDPLGKLRTAEENLPNPIVPEHRFDAIVLDDTEVLDTLTLEEFKLKVEADRIFEITEGTKEIIRRQLRKLKVDYRTILQKNDEIPVQFRLPRSKFELDPRIKEPRQTRFQKEVELIYRRYEWDGSRSVIGCEKIQKYFLNGIETHHRSVKDLEHIEEVHTFRHRFLTPEFWEIFQTNQQTLVNEKSIVEEEFKLEQKLLEVAPVEVVPVKRVYAKDLIGEYTGKKYDVKTTHAIKQLEERLNRKYVHECEWAELNALQVPDNYEAEEDLEAIRFALVNTGDYKLKSSEEFLIGDKTTMAERRKKILDLKIMIYDSIKDFNRRLEILENEKFSVIEACRKIEHEIRERHKYLPLEQRVTVPVVYDIDPSDSPESIFNISQQNITNLQNQKLEAAGLLKRKKNVNEEDLDKTLPETPPDQHKPKVKRRIHKAGDFLRNCNDPRAPKVILKKLEQPVSTQMSGPTVKTLPKRKDLEGLSMAVYRYRKAFFNPKTDAGIRRRDRILINKNFERDYYLELLHRLIDYFKHRVVYVRNERIELELDIKLMSIALLTYIQEVDIVKDFEHTESDVLERYDKMKFDLETAKRRLEKSRRRLNQGKRDQRKVEDLLTKLAKEVTILVNEQGRFSEFLWKVFRKKIRLGGADEEDEHASEHSSDSSDSVSDGGSSKSSSSSYGGDLFNPRKTVLSLNVCPDEIETEIYNKVCDLRQQKAFLDADLTAQKEVVGRLTDDFNSGNETFQDCQARMGGLQEEINSLQRDRQTLINNLRKLVILKASQVQCIDEDKLETDTGPIIERIKRNFPDIDEVIVFPKDGTLKLDQRLDELKEEIRKQTRKQERARYMMVRLREELHKKEERVATLVEECRKDMIGRFGRVVDMIDICVGSINLEVIDIMDELQVKSKQHYAENDRMKKRLDKTRRDLSTVTVGNSELNIMLAMLEERQRDVDYFLYQQNYEALEPKTAEVNSGVTVEETPEVVGVNDDVILETYEVLCRLVNQERRINYLHEILACCKAKGCIPEITLMTSIPDKVGSKFMTFRELQEYKEYINKEVKMLYAKNNTERLLESTSGIPSFDASHSQVKNRPSLDKVQVVNQQEGTDLQESGKNEMGQEPALAQPEGVETEDEYEAEDDEEMLNENEAYSLEFMEEE